MENTQNIAMLEKLLEAKINERNEVLRSIDELRYQIVCLKYDVKPDDVLTVIRRPGLPPVKCIVVGHGNGSFLVCNLVRKDGKVSAASIVNVFDKKNIITKVSQ